MAGRWTCRAQARSTRLPSRGRSPSCHPRVIQSGDVSSMISAVLLAAALQAPPSDSLTLDAALSLARRRRGQIAATGAVVAGARADFRVAGTIPNPSASYSHTESVPRDHATVDQSLDWLFR